MVWISRIFFFALLRIMDINGFELNTYLEQDKNVLFGSDTPIFHASLKSVGWYEDEDIQYVLYERQQYQLLEEKNDRFERSRKNESNVEAEENIVYPEILVVIDYETYLFYDKNVTSIILYMNAFWNGVDIKFRQMSDPKVRLNIAGLILTMDSKSENYLKRDGKYFVNEMTLIKIGEHFKQRSFDFNYDVVVVIAHRVLRAKKFNEKISGLSIKNGFCKGNNSIAIVYDAGGFEGITTTAQELAHIFGSNVDSNNCHGFITNSKWKVSNKAQFSNCSLNNMRSFLRSNDADCLKKKPFVGIPLPKKLPGMFMNAKDQCAVIFPNLAEKDNIFYEKNNCTVLNCLYCIKWDWFCFGYSTHYIPPAEGTDCGENSICISGKCTNITETNV